jgi:hypothetical protein
LPYCHNLNVNVHHNSITSNSSTGDELFSATPAGAGGISFCTGADFYKFNYNWVCGNLSTGDGGGIGHLGFSYNGDIEHNTIIFNQSTNPTIPTNGGGLIVMGAPDADPVCPNAAADTDCLVLPNAVGPSDGIGPQLTINANLIMGNAADSGTGGGIAFQNVNGSEVVAFPTTPSRWNHVTLTNNIIVNNVAGWDGAGVSLLDALNTDIINNTIADNDTTASAGPLFNTLGAPVASQQGPTCTANCGTTSAPQPAGLVSIQNSAILTANLPATITCPSGHFAPGTSASNGSCKKASYPTLENNVIWKNRPFYIGVGALGAGTLNQQNVVTLYEAFTTTAAPSQSQTDTTTADGNGTIITGGTGACVAFPATSYWDIGVRGDTGPANHASTITLNPTYSVMTSIAGYNANNTAVDPTLLMQYCNGSRIPPENTTAGGGWQVPPGISDATVPNPVFNLTPAATVDEGNNWINISWGPLSLSNPVSGNPLSNYGPATGSSVINFIPNTATANYAAAPPTDFYGNLRKGNNAVDAGAVEYQASGPAALAITPTSLPFGNQVVTTTSAAQTLTLSNSGGATATAIAVTVTAPFSRPTGTAGGTCGATLAGGTTCTINIVFSPTATGAASGTATITANVVVSGSPVSLTGTGIAAVRTATVTPSTLAFGNQAIGTASGAKSVTVTNTGNVALAGGAFTFGGGTPQPFSRPFLTGGTCGATLAVGASCTYNVVFTPATGTLNGTAFTRTLAVAYTTATVTGSPVTLTGTAVTPGTLTFTSATNGTLTTTLGVRTLTFTIPTPRAPVTSVVTITNTGAGALQITGETLTQIGALYSVTNTTCSFTAPLATGGTCTVSVTYATPATAPTLPDVGNLPVANNGSGTLNGNSNLVLSAQ